MMSLVFSEVTVRPEGDARGKVKEARQHISWKFGQQSIRPLSILAY